jgi:hypothetical protein
MFKIGDDGIKSDARVDGVKYNKGRCRETLAETSSCVTIPVSASSKDVGRDIEENDGIKLACTRLSMLINKLYRCNRLCNVDGGLGL